MDNFIKEAKNLNESIVIKLTEARTMKLQDDSKNWAYLKIKKKYLRDSLKENLKSTLIKYLIFFSERVFKKQ